MLFSGLVDGERRNAGDPACLVEIDAGRPERPAWCIFSRLALIAASMGVGCLAGGQKVVEMLERDRAWPVVAASRVFQIVSTRPAPTSLAMSARSIRPASPA